MKKIIFTLLIFLVMGKAFAQELVGKVVTEENMKLENVMLFNLRNHQKAYTDAEGVFKILAQPTDEIRLVKKGYERLSHRVKNTDFGKELVFKMMKSEVEIEEVEIISKNKMEELQKNIGIRHVKKGTPSKPKPAEWKDLLKTVLNFSPAINLNTVEELANGDARRKKNLYQYEDFQEKVSWIQKRIETEFFTENGIPEERIPEFIGFSITEKTEINQYIKTRDVVQVRNLLEKTLPIYLERLKKQEP